MRATCWPARVLLLAVAAVLWVAGPALRAIGNWNLFVFFVLLLGAAVLSGLPIAFGFALATVAYLLTATATPLQIVIGRMGRGHGARSSCWRCRCSCCWAS